MTILSALLAALLATGCGSSDSSTAKNDKVTVGTGSLTKIEFIEQADELCEKARQRFQVKFETLVKEGQGEENALAGEQGTRLVSDVLVPEFGRLVDEISSLGAPSGDEKQVSDFLNSLQHTLNEVQANPAPVFESLTPFDRSIKLAKAYGLSGCAQSLG